MTCIAGAIKDGEVCIGGDAVSVEGNSNVRISAEGKVFSVGEFLIGAAGTVRTRQIMSYLCDPPTVEGDLMSYMVRQFVPALRSAMKEHGGEVETDSKTVEMDAQYLIAVRGRLFHVDGGYGVFESKHFYAAMGCAAQEALAGMFTADRLLPKLSAEDIVYSGLLAAAEFDTSIRPPFTIMTLKESDWQGDNSCILKPNGEWKHGQQGEHVTD